MLLNRLRQNSKSLKENAPSIIISRHQKIKPTKRNKFKETPQSIAQKSQLFQIYKVCRVEMLEEKYSQMELIEKNKF